MVLRLSKIRNCQQYTIMRIDIAHKLVDNKMLIEVVYKCHGSNDLDANTIEGWVKKWAHDNNAKHISVDYTCNLSSFSKRCFPRVVA